MNVVCAVFLLQVPVLDPDGWLGVNVVCAVFLMPGPSFRSRQMTGCECGVCCRSQFCGGHSMFLQLAGPGPGTAQHPQRSL